MSVRTQSGTSHSDVGISPIGQRQFHADRINRIAIESVAIEPPNEAIAAKTRLVAALAPSPRVR
jgi:hypothetical protein